MSFNPANNVDVDSAGAKPADSSSSNSGDINRTRSTPREVLRSSRLDIGEMLCNRPPDMDFVLPGLPLGAVGVLAGPGGVGKTMLELQIVMALAAGLPVLEGHLDTWAIATNPAKGCRVVLVAAEEPAVVLWQRIHAVAHHIIGDGAVLRTGLDPAELRLRWEEHLHIYALAGWKRISLLNEQLRRTPEGESLYEACQGARLVILDPVRQFHNGDENDSRVMSALVREAHRLGRDASDGTPGPAVLLAHHTSRAASRGEYGDSADAARGSTALTDGVRWQLNLSRLSGTAARLRGIPEQALGHHLTLSLPKANYIGPQNALGLRRLHGGYLTVDDDLRDCGMTPVPAKRSARKQS